MRKQQPRHRRSSGPGASGDQGIYADRVELDGIRPRFPIPDFSGAYKFTQGWGYVRAAGILRAIKWDDVQEDAFDLSGIGHRVGHQPQLQLEVRQQGRPAGAVRVR